MTQKDGDALAGFLHDRFDAQVDVEEVARGRFRFTLVSDRFANVGHLQRQDEVWEAIDAHVTREQGLDISLILTLAPDDLQIAP